MHALVNIAGAPRPSIRSAPDTCTCTCNLRDQEPAPQWHPGMFFRSSADTREHQSGVPDGAGDGAFPLHPSTCTLWSSGTSLHQSGRLEDPDVPRLRLQNHLPFVASAFVAAGASAAGAAFARRRVSCKADPSFICSNTTCSSRASSAISTSISEHASPTRHKGAWAETGPAHAATSAKTRTYPTMPGDGRRARREVPVARSGEPMA
mmetsp:Transcript_64154/g.200858  ORF Transcript_64154/g.200858 Transcript_64154/m.200858 type:complete len:207 (+) Transcript_64154:2-622(+)